MKLRSVYILLIAIAMQSYAISIPSEFNEIVSKSGVTVYKKNYSGGMPDYVQVINLNKGAEIKLLIGSIADEGIGEGAYGGNNPSINRESLSNAWENFSTKEENAVCITNGEFFSTNKYPTTLAFPVKTDEKEIDGYGDYEYPNQKLVLEVYDDYAKMSNFYGNMNNLSNNFIVGLTEDADKGFNEKEKKNTYTARTFIGICDTDNDGYAEDILIFNSSYARQTDASEVLKNFGAEKVMMLDGGGSTQLICEGNSFIASSRTIPQTIGVIEATIEKVTETKTLSYKEKCDFVFDKIEENYSSSFSNGSNTLDTDNGHYRYYKVKNKTYYLYAYKSYLWVKTTSDWDNTGSTLEEWYSYFKDN